MKIIAIETSHDDTSVVLYEDKNILKEFSYSQTEFHKMFGGTVPEFASRGHYERMPRIIKDLMSEDLSGLNHIAYTNKPGLIGSLHVGALTAKALSFAFGVPAKPINHMYGHIYAICFSHDITYPAVSLIVSGGHTQLWLVKGANDIDLIGETSDDAVGEVYDKIARALKLGFPGGPIIDKRANMGSKTIDFSIKIQSDFKFSFSGMKTKVINYIHNNKQKGVEINIDDVCHSFQEDVVENLIQQTKKAIIKYKPNSIILGGGVSANSRLRQEFLKLHDNALVPEMRYTTDNAMMIAIRSHMKEINNE